MGNGILSDYAVRTYVVTANQPVALPAAREFLVVSASVDITQLYIALGDENGDPELWPFGISVGVRDGSTRARFVSTVGQTVVIAMATGQTLVKDNRFAPGPGSLAVTVADGADAALGAKADAAAATDAAVASLIALFKRSLVVRDEPHPFTAMFSVSVAAGAAGTAANIVAGGANVNGILVTSAQIACLVDPGAQFYFTINGVVWLLANDSQVVAQASSIVIPAGQPLGYSRAGGGTMTVTYRIL